MTANILMLILTLAEGGLYSAAFVNTDSMADCQRRAATVQAILEAGGTQIERIACRPSRARFEPFVHGAGQAGERRSYLIRIDETQASVEPLQPGAACDTAGADSVYCATSGQAPLPEGR